MTKIEDIELNTFMTLHIVVEKVFIAGQGLRAAKKVLSLHGPKYLGLIKQISSALAAVQALDSSCKEDFCDTLEHLMSDGLKLEYQPPQHLEL